MDSNQRGFLGLLYIVWIFFSFLFAAIGSQSNHALFWPILIVSVIAPGAAFYGFRAIAERERARNIRAQFPEHAPAIIARQVAPGMTSAMVRAAFGPPNEIGEQSNSKTTRIIWRYYTYNRRRKYKKAIVTFINDLVDSVER